MGDVIFSTADCWVGERGLFARPLSGVEVPAAVLQELKRLSRPRMLAKAEAVIMEGDPSETVGIIVSGVLKVTKTSAAGHQQIVGLLFPGDFFGRLYVETVPFAYEAATTAALCTIGRRSFERILSAHPDLENALFRMSLNKLDALREWIGFTALNTSAERLAIFLYTLSLRAQKNAILTEKRVEGGHIALPISRRDIASFLLTTPETLSRNLQSLVRAEILHFVDLDHFEVLDPEGLAERTGLSREDLASVAGANRLIRSGTGGAEAKKTG